MKVLFGSERNVENQNVRVPLNFTSQPGYNVIVHKPLVTDGIVPQKLLE